MSLFTPLNTELFNYICQTSLREHAVLEEIRTYTQTLKEKNMQISPIQGQFMTFLMRIIQAKSVLEVGTFTGYSSTAMALQLPSDGKLITCDMNKEWTNQAKVFWKKAGVLDKIELRLGHALKSLETLIKEEASFDFIFLDADKENYLHYYEASLQLLNPRGILVIDNVLWDGNVIHEEDQRESTKTIRQLNAFLLKDQRVHISMINVADGLFLVQKKSHSKN